MVLANNPPLVLGRRSNCSFSLNHTSNVTSLDYLIFLVVFVSLTSFFPPPRPRGYYILYTSLALNLTPTHYIPSPFFLRWKDHGHACSCRSVDKEVTMGSISNWLDGTTQQGFYALFLVLEKFYVFFFPLLSTLIFFFIFKEQQPGHSFSAPGNGQDAMDGWWWTRWRDATIPSRQSFLSLASGS